MIPTNPLKRTIVARNQLMGINRRQSPAIQNLLTKTKQRHNPQILASPRDKKNLILQNLDQMLKNQVGRIRLLPSQMRKTVVAQDPVIRAVLQNRRKRIVELQGQRNRISHDQISKIQVVKIRLLPSQMRKTVEAPDPVIIPDPVIRAVLQNHQKRIVELQGLRNRISQSRDQMSKIQMRKTVVAQDPVIIPDQTIRAVLQNHLKKIVELQALRNRISRSHHQTSKI